MQLIRKKKISQLPLLESTTENTYIHVIDGDENYKIEADKLTAAYASKTYVDQQDALKVDKVIDHSLVPDLEIEKLAGIEENANNYTHPETHPSSILDVVDVVNGAANKFFNERGEMVPLKHESLTDKNKEAAFQHIDTTTTKPTLDAADMVAIKDSVTGNVVLTPKSNLQTDLTNVNQAITNLQNDKANKAQESWITPTLLNGWVNNKTLQYKKTTVGLVTIRGEVGRGSSGTIVFELPVGYRPSQNTSISINSNHQYATADITIQGYFSVVGSKVGSYTIINITFFAD